MPGKHQSDLNRHAGKWICWQDGLRDDITKEMVKELRAQGFKVMRRGSCIFVLKAELDRIFASATKVSPYSVKRGPTP